MDLTQASDSALAEVDRALAKPPCACAVCGVRTEGREYCCSYHRLQLYLMRRGLDTDGVWSEMREGAW